MELITVIIVVFIVLAAASLVWWGLGRMALPEPVKTVVLVVFGLLCLLVIYHFVVGGGLSFNTR
jgi:hypothetical protein